MSSRILVAGLFHETHTFLDDVTPLDAFEVRRGAQMLDCLGDSSPLGGSLEYFQNLGYELLPVCDYRSTPSGTVGDEVYHSFWLDFESRWDPGCDAIYLVLHGAMVTESILDVEGDLLRRIRSLPGASEIPIFGVYDLHANFSKAMAVNADALVAYRTNPHEDARAAAINAARLLDECLRCGVRPAMEFRHTGLIWAPVGTGTADDPMKSLQSLARSIERTERQVRAVNVNAGFAFADTPSTGVSFQIVTMQRGRAGDLLDQLAGKALELAPRALGGDLPLENVLARIQREPSDGLTVLVEPSDNIGAGAPGDGTGLLRGLLQADIRDAAVCLNDPEAVSRLERIKIAKSTRLGIGGRGSRFDEGPLELDVTLVSRSTGVFELDDKQSHLASMSGDTFDMGPCAVVRHAGVTVLITSRRTPPFDLGQWRSQGIEPASLRYIVVKAAVAHRKAYDPITQRSFTVDTPGPCRSDLSCFNYQYAKTASGS